VFTLILNVKGKRLNRHDGYRNEDIVLPQEERSLYCRSKALYHYSSSAYVGSCSSYLSVCRFYFYWYSSLLSELRKIFNTTLSPIISCQSTSLLSYYLATVDCGLAFNVIGCKNILLLYFES
jgi:hypothetical protein